MDFPMRIPFKLGKVKNTNSWTDETSTKFYELVTIINEKINNKKTNKIITPLNTSVNLTAEHNIGEIESTLSPGSYNININIESEKDKLLYFLIVDSNKSTFSLTSTLGIHNNENSSFNRTLYIIRKLDESNIVIYKELKDMYFPDPSDFESTDFLDWDLTAG